MSQKPIETRASELFRRAGKAEALSPEQLEAVWKKTAPRLAASSPAVGKVIGAGVVVLVVVGAALVLMRSEPAVPVRVVPSPSPRPRPSQVSPHPDPLPLGERETVVPSPPPRPRAERRQVAPVEVVVPVEVEDPVLAESRLLAKAVAELRDRHDAPAALKTLDEYSQRFANGVLRNEATLTRVEALVAASERKQALTLLESLDLTVTPRGSELRVLRAEFLLEDGRRDAARADFEQALTGKLVRDVEERALIGLANALSDESLARQAFQRYLERFPGGRFAAQARDHLE